AGTRRDRTFPGIEKPAVGKSSEKPAWRDSGLPASRRATIRLRRVKDRISKASLASLQPATHQRIKHRSKSFAVNLAFGRESRRVPIKKTAGLIAQRDPFVAAYHHEVPRDLQQSFAGANER